ncbi:MAG: hypothetical protein HLUCCA08_06395 [Rhodobacteraceae bacterium HLUCCA08]|nr:MAG: hypothetical protein HLUCCA08_06395 [Rhodobacteraceae bacterium HLUCCA08]
MATRLQAEALLPPGETLAFPAAIVGDRLERPTESILRALAADLAAR